MFGVAVPAPIHSGAQSVKLPEAGWNKLYDVVEDARRLVHRRNWQILASIKAEPFTKTDMRVGAIIKLSNLHVAPILVSSNRWAQYV
jgi:hypothetical protein